MADPPGRRGDGRAAGPGASVVQPPEDPAELGALNRALAARGVGWSYGTSRHDAVSDSGAVVGARGWRDDTPAVDQQRAHRGARQRGRDAVDGPRRRRDPSRQPARSGLDRPAGIGRVHALRGSCCSTAWPGARSRWRSGAPGDPVPLPDMVTESAPGRARMAGGRRRAVPPPGAWALYYLVGAGHRRRDQRRTSTRASRAWPGRATRRRGSSGRARGWWRWPERRRGFLCGSRGDLRGPLLLAALAAGLAEVGLASGWRRQRVTLRPVLDAFARTPAAADLRNGCRRGARRSGWADCRAPAERCSRPGWQRLSAAAARRGRPHARRRRAVAHRPRAPHRRRRGALSPARGAGRGRAALRDRG